MTRPRALLLAMALITGTASAQGFPATARRSIDSVALAELAAWRAPGMVLAIVTGDSIVYTGAYGIANSETGEKMSADMMVSVASVSKMVTATAAAVLAANGKLDLDAPVRTYLPWLAESIGGVSMTQLLSHTSGIDDRTPSVSPEPNGAMSAVCRAMTEGVVMARPSELWSYSNTGYTLAGCVIEAVMRVPFAQAVTQLLFQPLGMTRSTYNPRIAMTYAHAQGHDTRTATPVVVRPYNSQPSIAPAGELITTVGDLARLERALLLDGVVGGARVLPPGILARLSQKHGRGSPFLGDARDYGLGLFLREHRGLRIAEHEGIYGGFGASVALVPDKRIAAIAVSNGRYSAPARTTQAALELATGLQPSTIMTSTMPVSAKDSAAVIGRYARPSDTLTVAAVNGKLTLRQGERSYAIVGLSDGVLTIPGHVPSLPAPASPLELVNSGPDGHPGFVRLSWRAYRRLP